MPRTARRINESNIYHVMLRGVNRQNIFEEDADRYHFMSVLALCKKISGFRLHAFVLMSNHIHLLIEPHEEALDMIIPKYIAGQIHGALIEALASENGARMQAMDNATSNAEDMIDDLTLKYNRARQGSITQELTEIIAGSQALNG